MKAKSISVVIVAGTLLLSACVPLPSSVASTPVTVETPQGPVVCQFFLPDIVLWDMSNDRPATMTKEEADKICIEAGEERARTLGGAAPASPEAPAQGA
jgi:hypothetical protein